MKHDRKSDFVYQFFALIISVIVIHAVYVTVIRPSARALLAEQAERQAAGEIAVTERSVYIVIKDFEQETCFILALWAMAIIGLKARYGLEEQRLLFFMIIW